MPAAPHSRRLDARASQRSRAAEREAFGVRSRNGGR
ncbi:hypothetical protein BPC006_II0031 [Burkholderia pseudomallei BPC006]|nr:hypothetical protein BPC006_II0031 [Burkholderia pseudomallei BPC006]